VPFHTERFTCQSCATSFIAGAEREDVPGEYHFFQVECPRCHGKVDATWDGEVRLQTLQVAVDGP
jgi:hypothetical protein